MVACCTIAYVVACKSMLNAEEIEVARTRIRVCIGTLKTYEHAWPRARKILTELKHIASGTLDIEIVRQPSHSYTEYPVDQEMDFAGYFDAEGFLAQDWDRIVFQGSSAES